MTGDMSALLDILARLRLRGFQISIDDFGTGYSSLSQLAKSPVTELKIDRSFVHQAYNDSKRRIILETSIALAHKLGLSTTAEGVEDEADWQLVSDLDCDLVQGYHIARPMPAENFNRWHQQWKARHNSTCNTPG